MTKSKEGFFCTPPTGGESRLSFMDTQSQRVPMGGVWAPSPLASSCQDFSISHYSLLLGTLKSDVHPSTS